jgi:sRNA-binding protein
MLERADLGEANNSSSSSKDASAKATSGEEWWTGTETCPEYLYGYDKNGRCRTDYYKPPNGVLDRFAKKVCCEAYEEAKATHIAAVKAAAEAAAKAEAAAAAAAAAAARAEAAKLAAGTLNVKIHSAENLPDFDPGWFTGKTDAFVVVTTGSQRANTNAIVHSANPTWDWSHSFNVAASDTDCDLVVVEVFDHDVPWNFFMEGNTTHDKISDLDIQFRTLTPNQWVELEENMKTSEGKDAGKLKYALMWAPSGY